MQVNYQPSVMAPAADPPQSEHDNMSKEQISGQRVRVAYGHTDEYKQAGERYRSFNAAR